MSDCDALDPEQCEEDPFEPSGDENDEDLQDPAPAPEPEPECAVNEPVKKKYEGRKFITSFKKAFYEVPAGAVMFDAGRPVKTASGLDAYKLHDSKSFPLWTGAGVVERHMVKLSVPFNGERQVGWYITFKIAGQETSDICILRPVHKTIADKFFALWTADSVSPERKKTYAELLVEKPSPTAQINPEYQRWRTVDTPPDVLYARPKVAPKGAKRARKNEDDVESSATTTTTNSAAATTVAPQLNRSEHEVAVPGLGSGAQIFMQTPGVVTVSETYFRFLIENQKR